MDKCSFQYLGSSNPHACFYQFVIDKPNKYPVLIAHFFIANGLRICANLQSLVSHMFYGLTFSHCSAVLIMLRKCKIFIFEEDDTTLFAWGNSLKIKYFYSNA